MSQPEDRLQGLSIYTSTSMLRVFTPGDLVETDDAVPFSELRCGDVIVFPSTSGHGERIIHRIIKRTEDTITTMGDNNPAPDRNPVTAVQKPSLAVAKILPDGTRVPLRRGASGMIQFRVNRCSFHFMKAVRRIGAMLAPFMFWRVRLTEARRFGDVTFYYRKGVAVARKDMKGLRFLKPQWRLFYRIDNQGD